MTGIYKTNGYFLQIQILQLLSLREYDDPPNRKLPDLITHRTRRDQQQLDRLFFGKFLQTLYVRKSLYLKRRRSFSIQIVCQIAGVRRIQITDCKKYSSSIHPPI